MAARDEIKEEIDRLYQLPLEEFTAARDATAKRLGAQGADVRRLQKPNAAAWAVNQLFWRRSKPLEKLTTASERLRAAHAARLSGKAADVGAAEAAHKQALTAAVDAARDVLTAAGDAASPATLQAVSETLQALLWNELDGRLTRPLKTSGFEALAGLTIGKGSHRTRTADVIPIRPAPQPIREDKAERATREAEAKRREVSELERELPRAISAERDAAKAANRATDMLDRAERARASLEAELEKATANVHDLRRALETARAEARTTATERTRLEERLDALRDGD